VVNFRGVVQLMMPLDRETQDTYQLRVIAFDKVPQPADRSVVNDRNV